MWGSRAHSGDVGSSALPGVFWGAVSPGLAAGPGSRACWKGCLQLLLLGIPGNTWLWSSVGERWDTTGEKSSVTL